MLPGPFHLMDMAWMHVRKHRRIFSEAVLWIVALSVLQWAVYYFGEAFIADPLLRMFVSMLILFPLALVAIAVGTAFITLADDATAGRAPSLKTALAHGFHLLVPMIWVSILSGVAMMAGFIALIIPGLLLIVYLAFAKYALAINGLRGGAALRASWDAVSGRFWQVLARLVLPNLIYLAIAAIPAIAVQVLLGIAFGNLPLVFSAESANALPLMQSFLITVVVSLLNGFIVPLAVTTGVLLWKALLAEPVHRETASPSPAAK